MSRSGYSEDLDNWDLIKWRGQVVSAIRGRRGQTFLRDMLAALEALPQKRLIADDLIDTSGEVCAMGALGLARGVDLSRLDPEDPDQIARAFDIASQLAQEVAYENDEYFRRESPEQRYERMHKWIQGLIAAEVAK